jgi:hypothetical protein
MSIAPRLLPSYPVAPILSCSSSSPVVTAHCTCLALRICIHNHHLTHHWPFLRTGVTSSPHLFLCAPPLHALSRRRLDTAPAHKEGLEAPHRLKGRTYRNRSLQPWSPKEKPPILSVPTIRERESLGLCYCDCNYSRARAHAHESVF